MPGVGRDSKRRGPKGALPHTTFRLTPTARRNLAKLAKIRGVSRTAVIEMMLRGEL